jgi:hypothetical protein
MSGAASTQGLQSSPRLQAAQRIAVAARTSRGAGAGPPNRCRRMSIGTGSEMAMSSFGETLSRRIGPRYRGRLCDTEQSLQIRAAA